MIFLCGINKNAEFYQGKNLNPCLIFRSKSGVRISMGTQRYI